MLPSPSSDPFWAHVPDWLWPVIVGGFVCLIIKQGIEASDSVAGLFGKAGRYLRNRAVEKQPYFKEIKFIKGELMEMRREQEITFAYLVTDAQWHNKVDIILAERGVLKSLPPRIPFSEFDRKWREEDWRPALAA